MDRLRTPLLVLALAAAALVVLIELGSGWLSGGATAGGAVAELEEIDRLEGVQPAGGRIEEPPGRATRYLVLIDGLVLYTLGLITASVVVPRRLHGRIQGVITMVVSFLWLLLAVAWALIAVVELVIMASLFFSGPFGALAYLARWGFFPLGRAGVVLGLVAVLKVAMAAALFAAHPRFATQKGLLLLLGLSAGVHLVLVVLHGLFPRVVVAMVDTTWAIVLAVVAAVYAVVLLVGSIPSVVRAVRVNLPR